MDYFESYGRDVEESPDQFLSEAPEGLLQKIARNAARGTSRFLEGLLGVGGDLYKGYEQNVLSPLLQGVTRQPKDIVEKSLERTRQVTPAHYFPTTEELREKSSKVLGQWSEPKSDTERSFDEALSTTGSIFGPGGVRGLGKAGLTAFGGQFAKELSKATGSTPGEQEAIKLGTMIAASLIDPKGAKRYVDELYKNAEAALPPNQMVPTQGLINDITAYERQLAKGTTDDALKNPILKGIQQIRNKMQGAMMPLEENYRLKQDLNRWIYSKSDAPETFSQKGIAKLVGMLNKNIYHFKNRYPEFAKNLSKADLGYRGLSTKNQAADYVSKQAKNLKLEPETIVALTFAHGGPAAVAGLGGLKGLGGATRIAKNFRTNKTLRNYYLSAMKNAISQNKGAVISDLRKLDTEIKEMKNRRTDTGQIETIESIPEGVPLDSVFD